MVRLKAYRCQNCSLICEASDKYFVGICLECGKLTCGPCRTLFELEAEKATKCTVTQKNCVYRYPYTIYLDYLHKFAPDDELKLLNYGKWCPMRCNNTCASSFATQRIGYVSNHYLLCTKCLPAGRTVNEPPINTYMRIIDELRDYFSAQECIGTTRKEMQLELECQLCKASVDFYNYNVYFTKTGDLMCYSCRAKSSAYQTPRRGSCIYWLFILLRYIPDIDDLKLLTYSKWTPLRCELCSSPFSTNFLQLPMFHPGCSKIMCNQCLSKHTCSEANTTSILLRCVLDVDKELRSLFKNGGDDPPATPFKKTASDEAQYNSLSLPSTYDLDKTTSSDASTIPDKIKCESCAQLNTPSNLRMCSDCKKSCLCCICLTKEHWGHHIDELETSLQTTYIQKESEKTLEKLANWTDSVTEGYRQIHVGCGKVVDNYNWLYTKAIRETDLALLHTIRERSNIGQLKTSIDRLIGAQIMVRSNVEELAKSLSDIVTEEKAVCAENDVASNAAGASTSK